ncbi:tryptophan--tRNA ligase [Patescibacteria group bacterium]|nr:tryptophan--tRNA ligase [Patescibacteria group bacterium]
MKSQQTIFSGIQPSGDLHIGHYFGAMKNWVALQNQYRSIFCIVDEHAITVPQDPEKLRERTLDIAMWYLAAGIDPKRSIIFVQSHNSDHTELSWILNTITPFGELERMTQFKDKSSKMKKAGIPAGLLNYPTLMAADILLYQTDAVPVGEDQKQHVELARTLARKFNSRFGVTFKEPKELIQKFGSRIMSLQDPTKKMSKSDENKNSYIGLLDAPDDIRGKIKIAVTDSGKEIIFNQEKKPAIANLLTIFSLFSGLQIKDIEKKYKRKGYGEFKKDLGNIAVAHLEPLQQKYRALKKNPEQVKEILREGVKSAKQISSKTLADAKQKIGFL